MEKDRVKRYPHLNMSAIKACYLDNSSQKTEKDQSKILRKRKKMKKADLQRKALFEEAEGPSEDVDDKTEPASDESDEVVGTDDLGVTDVGEEVDEDEQQQEADHMEEFSVYPNPAEVIDCKRLTKDSVLIGLPLNATIFFKGCLQVRVLHGCLDVFGHRIQAGTEAAAATATRLYSPRGSSLLPLHAFQSLNDQQEAAVDAVESEGVQGDCLFVARRLAEPWTDYVQSRMKKSWKLSLFGRDQERDGGVRAEEEDEEGEREVRLKEMEKTLNITLIDPARNGARLCEVGEDWELAVTSLRLAAGRRPRLLAAGGKGVGKSTFVRWLANRLLLLPPAEPASRPVVYLDLDPGQREFGLPGYISLAVLESPLLGPNFCRDEKLATCRSIFVGDISVSNCPGRYLAAVSQLVSWAGELDPTLPWLVNTMGWCKGLGLLLMKDVIQLCEPTTVVQIHSRFHRKNFPVSLSPDYISSQGNCWRRQTKTINFSLLEFLAVPERHNAKDMRSKDSWGMPDPRTARELQLLAWLGRAGGLAAVPVYRVPFHQVALHVCHTSDVPPCGLLAALNLALVDLCHVNLDELKYPEDERLYATLESTPVVESLGTGIIRHIDSDACVLYVATTTNAARLAAVNCLLAGAASLPESIFLEAAGAAGRRRTASLSRGLDSSIVAAAAPPLPYVAVGPTDPLDTPWQRSHQYGKHSF